MRETAADLPVPQGARAGSWCLTSCGGDQSEGTTPDLRPDIQPCWAARVSEGCKADCGILPAKALGRSAPDETLYHGDTRTREPLDTEIQIRLTDVTGICKGLK